jgi:hypothetical protein
MFGASTGRCEQPVPSSGDSSGRVVAEPNGYEDCGCQSSNEGRATEFRHAITQVNFDYVMSSIVECTDFRKPLRCSREQMVSRIVTCRQPKPEVR